MDIGALSFNTDFHKDMIGKVEEEKAKDFDDIFKKAVESKDDQVLKDACVQLESHMLSQLFKQMKRSMVSEEGLIPKGDYEKTFEDLMVNNQSENLAKAGGIGIADMMYKQMTNTYAKQVKTDSLNSDQKI